MIPLAGSVREVEHQKEIIVRVAKEVLKNAGMENSITWWEP